MIFLTNSNQVSVPDKAPKRLSSKWQTSLLLTANSRDCLIWILLDLSSALNTILLDHFEKQVGIRDAPCRFENFQLYNPVSNIRVNHCKVFWNHRQLMTSWTVFHVSLVPDVFPRNITVLVVYGTRSFHGDGLLFITCPKYGISVTSGCIWDMWSDGQMKR